MGKVPIFPRRNALDVQILLKGSDLLDEERLNFLPGTGDKQAGFGIFIRVLEVDNI